MRERFSGSMLAAIAAAGAVFSGTLNPTAAQAPMPPAAVTISTVSTAPASLRSQPMTVAPSADC